MVKFFPSMQIDRFYVTGNTRREGIGGLGGRGEIRTGAAKLARYPEKADGRRRAMWL